MREGRKCETTDGGAEVFGGHRRRLFSIAYRMLGSVADAEDVVQEAYLRWRRVSDRGEVSSPGAYLSTVVTRLCIDRLRSARARREEYVGPWLPEPLVAEPSKNAADRAVVLNESVSMAFLVLLESLSPTERAVFVLREVFGYGYDEVSRLVGKSEANCRQIARRARESVAARRPRFEASRERHEELTQRFVEACRSGDADALKELLAEDVVSWSDGGGRVQAARRPIQGRESVARFLVGISAAGRAPEGYAVRPAEVNGRPGRVLVDSSGAPFAVISLEVGEEAVRAVRIVVNPDKLGHLR